MPASRRIVVLAFDGTQSLDVVGPVEVFDVATRHGIVPPYEVEVVAPTAAPVVTTSGITLTPARALGDGRAPVDTFVVAGGQGVDAVVDDPDLVAAVRRTAGRARRVASVCTGAFVLAEAGLLDGRRVTTHWASCRRLTRRYPELTVDPDPIFVRDGDVYTSAGVTAGMDLALALVEEDHGPTVAREVARELVLFLKRPGGQSQFSAQLAVQLTDRAPLAELQAWMVDHLADDLSVEALARRAAMSPRNFARVFAQSVGTTPARHVEQLRVEAARRRLEESDAGIDAIAAQCGFGSRESLRRAFARTVRVSPSAYRARFADEPHAPRRLPG